MQTLQEANQR